MQKEYADTSNWVHPNVSELESLVQEMCRGTIDRLVLSGGNELSFVKNNLETQGVTYSCSRYDRQFYAIRRIHN